MIRNRKVVECLMNNNNNNNIFAPSFKLEKKTKALNTSLWGFVGLISLFSTLFLIEIPYLFLSSFFNIVSAFLLDNLVLTLTIPMVIFAFIFGIGLFKFLNTLLISYKFDENKIIKGRIINPKKVKDINLVFDTLVTTSMVQNITNSNIFVAGNTARSMNNLLNLIKFNINQDFVHQFFDTDIYKKKIYNNPKLLKETKYNVVYICDENKKLVIPKLYEGMTIKKYNGKESSIFSRVLMRSLIVLGVFFIFAMIDLCIGINNNSEYMSNINNTCEVIQNNLSDYGYSKAKVCNFEKKVSNNRTSTIKYNINKHGNIENVDLELYYDSSSYSDQELQYILSTLHTDFSNNEINDFIKQVNSCVNGDCSYGKLKTLRIGSSGGFVNIHNY